MTLSEPAVPLHSTRVSPRTPRGFSPHWGSGGGLEICNLYRSRPLATAAEAEAGADRSDPRRPLPILAADRRDRL